LKKVQLNLNKLAELLTHFLQFPGSLPVTLESNTDTVFLQNCQK